MHKKLTEIDCPKISLFLICFLICSVVSITFLQTYKMYYNSYKTDEKQILCIDLQLLDRPTTNQSNAVSDVC